MTSKTIEVLLAAPTSSYGQSDARRRTAAREVVEVAAKELGFDPRQPPLPRFAGAGESPLAAAVRVLKLNAAAKALAEHERVRSACDAVEARFATLRARRAELQDGELQRIRSAVTSGRVPEPATAKLRDELATINAELDTVAGTPTGRLVPFRRPPDAVLAEALTEEQWLDVCLYVHLISDRLLSATESESYSSKARKIAERVNTVAMGYEKNVNMKRAAAEHYQALRAIRWCVEQADLHGLRAGERIRQERTLEELAREPVQA
jgi:hypothetical protein